jgi:hypothetical protein
VFRGSFSLASAAAVIVGQHIDPTQVLASVTQLVGKSLLNVEVGDEEVFYRLLDTTRHYALEKLELSGERETLRERHAERYLTLMEQAQTEWEHTPTTQWIERYARGLEDLRAALDWSLHGNGSRPLGIRLTATSAALWQELSLLKEYGAHVRQALTLLESAAQPCPRLQQPCNWHSAALVITPAAVRRKPLKRSLRLTRWRSSTTTSPRNCAPFPATWRSISAAGITRRHCSKANSSTASVATTTRCCH